MSYPIKMHDGDEFVTVDVWPDWKTEFPDADWQDLSLINSWDVVDPGWGGRADYMRRGGIVFLYLFVEDGTDAFITTLPSGFRPGKPIVFPVIVGGITIAQMVIQTAGTIQVSGPFNGDSVAGVTSFPAEQ